MTAMMSFVAIVNKHVISLSFTLTHGYTAIFLLKDKDWEAITGCVSNVRPLYEKIAKQELVGNLLELAFDV